MGTVNHEAFAQGVQRTGTDVPIDHPQRPKHHRPQAGLGDMPSIARLDFGRSRLVHVSRYRFHGSMQSTMERVLPRRERFPSAS